ncbi:MAG TPA: lipid-binding SYLF domain-containing protein [Nitrospira sp.]|nr:lipid-binding SYLF domain-containing protein [Nitrospira sp.]
MSGLTSQLRVPPIASSCMIGVVMGMASLFYASPAQTTEAAAQQQLVDKAQLTLEAFANEPQLKDSLKELSKEARALFIIPQFLRGAFIFGGAGGSGVLIARDEKSGKWGDPVFYNIGSASFGAQIGADVSEMVLVVRTRKGLEEFFTNDFKLGANAGMATGPVGAGMSAQGIAADIISYARQKGAFAGMAVDGAFVSVSNDSNKAYYGKAVRPTDIIVKKDIGNPKSLQLRAAADRLMK